MYKKAIALHLLFFCVPVLLFAQYAITDLKTEYTTTPLGMDVWFPRFSWKMHSAAQGAFQKAYSITVKNEQGKLVWSTGKKAGSGSLNIQYQGQPLQPRTRYTWTVSVWDGKDKQQNASSWFETGLMDAQQSLGSWSGARWIGGGEGDLPFYADYFPVFSISAGIQLNANSSRAGLIYGANDPRLMNRNKNIYQLASRQDSAYILVVLDIAPLADNDSARLHVYRAGYSPKDRSDVPLKTFTISPALINAANRYQKHTLSVATAMGKTSFYINGEGKEHLVGGMGLNPVGQGGDYTAFPVVAEIGLYVPDKQTASFSQVEVRNFQSPGRVLYKAHSTPVTLQGGGKWQLVNPSRNSMPMLRTAFEAKASPIAKARLYVTARGIYEVYINGRRIGNDYFHPGSTQYNKTHLYQTYDVTKEVVQGKNALGAILGEGWWSGGATYTGELWNLFGDQQSLLAKLVITHTDGKEEVIVTDPASWKYFTDGPVVYSSFFQGEVYDATKEAQVKGWSTAGYKAAGWHNALEVGVNEQVNQAGRDNAGNMTVKDDYAQLHISGQFGDAVQEVQKLTAKTVEEVRPGVFIYDMGQNLAGVPEITLKGLAAGTKIGLRFAEVKYPDLPAYKENTGMIMLENIRAAMAQDIYITNGDADVIAPRFTLHGFRYIEVTGIDHALPPEAVMATVLSSLHEVTADYTTSNAAINRLWENIKWSARANFLSIPTDCPQRNERLGWSGDISVFARTATYLAELPVFLRRHMLAMRDVQGQDGRFPDVAPLGVGFGGVLWGSAGITVAWESYQQYGDVQLLAEHYEAMKKYIAFLTASIDPVTNVLAEKERTQWSGLGDWLSPEYNRTEKTLLWEAYFVFDLELMGKMARVLNKQADAAAFDKLRAERKVFFNKTYTDAVTGKTAFRGTVIDNQASYAIPLALQVFDKAHEPAAAKYLSAAVARANKDDEGKVLPPYSLMTGFIGTAWILPALSDNGYAATAYRLFQQTSYPSWLYPVQQGATTIWERLNSYTHTNGFGGNNRMNSFNHYSFGAVGAWMCNRSLGIARDEKQPGFQHFILQPEPDPNGSTTFAKGYYEGMYGRIESSWELKGDTTYYRLVVPANSAATLYLKAASVNRVRLEGRPVAAGSGVRYTGKEGDRQVFQLNAGAYHWQVF